MLLLHKQGWGAGGKDAKIISLAIAQRTHDRVAEGNRMETWKLCLPQDKANKLFTALV